MMPFDSKTGREAGLASSEVRWGDKDPSTKRTEKFLVKVSPVEMEMINDKAKEYSVSRNDLIIRAVSEYEGE